MTLARRPRWAGQGDYCLPPLPGGLAKCQAAATRGASKVAYKKLGTLSCSARRERQGELLACRQGRTTRGYLPSSGRDACGMWCVLEGGPAPRTGGGRRTSTCAGIGK